MREVFNPYHTPAAEQSTASAQEKTGTQEKDVATASALSNMTPNICPKCGVTMGKAMIFDRREVYYCDTCRVTHPTA